jgi:tetratricopeptide (TPR) repeat protein
MCRTARSSRLAGPFLGLFLVLNITVIANGQFEPMRSGFITGQAAQAWTHWQAAMQGILDRNDDAAEQAFGELLALEPSPMRIALLAEHTVKNTTLGGALLLFEQDSELGALEANGDQVAEMLEVGRERKNQADDTFYFSQLGRFDVAGANLTALLEADPDPVALLEFVDRVQRRRDIMVRLLDRPVIGELMAELQSRLNAGELAIKADPTRITENIERLSGPPRGFENALAALKDSGEYAIPFMVQALRAADAPELLPVILRALPAVGRPGLNPMVIALRMDDDATKRYLIQALGQIGYVQAVPYLLQIEQADDTSSEVREAARAALLELKSRGARFDRDLPAAKAFFALAEDYYNERDSLMPDMRLEVANVWYWKDNLLQNVRVPTAIFNEVMAMRCCEEALRLDPEMKPAVALWVAANFRRQAQLPLGEDDATRPDNYPAGVYFAQSAGTEVCRQALARAVDGSDPAVALGTIQALNGIAGPAGLQPGPNERLPLAEALSFPDRLVRVRAALALGAALPKQEFHNYQNLMPVLSEALMMHSGAQTALVVDADNDAANAIAALLRNQDYEVITSASLFDGLQQVRDNLPGVDVIFLASNMEQPTLKAGLAEMRSEFRFASTPAILLTKPGTRDTVREISESDYRVGAIGASPSVGELMREKTLVMRAVGAEAITEALGQELAAEAAEVLRKLVLTSNPVFDVLDAQPALLAALETDSLELRATIAATLGYLGTAEAQIAVARIALDNTESIPERIRMFGALADAAKRSGNLLPDDMVDDILQLAEGAENLQLREAASQALGALNVEGSPASAIIRNQYRG